MSLLGASRSNELLALITNLCFTGMRELLLTAGDESQPEPWARVHAINSLRLTFNDKALANDVSGFFAEGECCCFTRLNCLHIQREASWSWVVE